MLFDYPPKASFGRLLPKHKIYEYARPSTAVKELFVRQVDQVVWQYKLAPETVNLPSTYAVPEIEIFTIVLREGELKHEVLRCIDQAIPFPIIFELQYNNQINIIAAYKRPSETDGRKWVISEYFETGLQPQSTTHTTLPMALNLEALYGQLLSPLMPYPTQLGETQSAYVDRMSQIRVKQREIAKSEVRLRKERQFNRKVEINAEFRGLKQELETLTRPMAAATP